MYALHYREELPTAVTRELDDFIAWLHGYLGTSLNEDGTLKLATPSGAGANGNTETFLDQVEEEEGHWWKRGPWIFDRENSHIAVISTASLPAQTINNFAPPGVETCVGMEVNLAGNITVTGLKAPDRNFRRLVFIRNQSSTNTITLKHQNSSSSALNRFALPNNVDIVMGALQTTWLYYDATNRRWACFITGNTSGGIVGAPTTTLQPGTTEVVFTVRLKLTTAQLDTLAATPITIIPAPGTNKVIQLISVICVTTRSGAWSASPNYQFRYNGIATNLTTGSPTSLLAGAGAGTQTAMSTVVNGGPSSSASNVAVEVNFSADTNPGAQTATAWIQAAYAILDVS